MDVWHWTPLVALLCYAGLRAIPDAYYQAARIDGASKFAVFRYIQLPNAGAHEQRSERVDGGDDQGVAEPLGVRPLVTVEQLVEVVGGERRGDHAAHRLQPLLALRARRGERVAPGERQVDDVQGGEQRPDHEDDGDEVAPADEAHPAARTASGRPSASSSSVRQPTRRCRRGLAHVPISSSRLVRRNPYAATVPTITKITMAIAEASPSCWLVSLNALR